MRRRQPINWVYLLFGGSVVLLVIAVALLQARRPPEFVPSAPPPPPERSEPHKLTLTVPYYRALVADDAKKIGLPVPTTEEMGRPLVHAVELTRAEPLRPGETLETPHLKLVASTAKRWASAGGAQRFSYEHLLLAMTNRSQVPIAYRVDTVAEPAEACRGKTDVVHNALVLDPGETAVRSECLWRPGVGLTVTQVEVIELPPLGRYYVNLLDPVQLGLDPRTAGGHLVDEAHRCALRSWRDVEAGGARWRDLIDFYARHSCAEYFFYPSYRFRNAPGPLPAPYTEAPASDVGAPDAG